MATIGIPRSIPSIDRRTLGAVALAALSALLVLQLTRPAPTVGVLIAAGDLAAGAPLQATSLAVRQVSQSEGLVDAAGAEELVGWTLSTPLRAGEPLLPSLLRPPARRAAPDTMALSMEESHAALGRLAPGDRVDLFVTWPATAGEPVRTEPLAESVFIVEVRNGGQTGLGGRLEVQLLVAVDDALAARLAAALRGGELDLVRVGP